jgi:hypothetical protein
MTNQTQAVASNGRFSGILATLREASVKTGSDFQYLLNTAIRESGLQPSAKSKNSSATGLFQFIDQTWLSLVKRHGGKHGLGEYAAIIQQNKSGGCSVPSAEMKAAILALRQNPELSALMAGEAARETKQSLECSLGREVNCGELYAAHFLGQGGAKRLLSLRDANPNQAADLAFPQAAKANRSVFYHADGRAKTIGELYSWIVKEPNVKPALAAVASKPVADAITLNVDCTVPGPSTGVAAAVKERAAQEISLYPASGYAAAGIMTRMLGLSGFPSMPLAMTPDVMDVLASARADRNDANRRI